MKFVFTLGKPLKIYGFLGGCEDHNGPICGATLTVGAPRDALDEADLPPRLCATISSPGSAASGRSPCARTAGVPLPACGRACSTERPGIISGLTVLIVPRDPAESTAFFRFQVLKTRRSARSLRARADLSCRPTIFSGPRRSATSSSRRLPPKLARSPPSSSANGRCVLDFDQFSQTYRLALRGVRDSSRARRSARPRSGITGCSIRRCPMTCRCWASGRIGRRPRPDRAPADHAHR